MDQMNKLESSFDLDKGSRGLWPIILEEELRAPEYYEPVLGLPDTLKAKLLKPLREEIVRESVKTNKGNIDLRKFDFHAPLASLNEDYSKSWKPLREDNSKGDEEYPVINSESAENFRKEVRLKIPAMIKENFPSLAGTEKKTIPDNWSPNSIS